MGNKCTGQDGGLALTGRMPSLVRIRTGGRGDKRTISQFTTYKLAIFCNWPAFDICDVGVACAE